MDISYASVDQIQAEIKTNTPTAASIALALAAGRFASGRIDELEKNTFAPVREVHWYDVPEYQLVNDRVILLTQRPLLEVETVTLPDASTWADGTEYTLWPRGRTPRTGLLLASTVDTDDLEPTAADDATFNIDGIWGWHSDYALAWSNATTLSAGVNDSVTVLPVTSAAALSEGMMLRLDDEYVAITSITANNLTVIRGIRGTTAAAHLISAVVAVFQPETTVVRAVQRWAAMLVMRIGMFEQVSFEMTGIVQFPPNMPPDVKAMLDDGLWNPIYERRGQGIYRALT